MKEKSLFYSDSGFWFWLFQPLNSSSSSRIVAVGKEGTKGTVWYISYYLLPPPPLTLPHLTTLSHTYNICAPCCVSHLYTVSVSCIALLQQQQQHLPALGRFDPWARVEQQKKLGHLKPIIQTPDFGYTQNTHTHTHTHTHAHNIRSLPSITYLPICHLRLY